MTSTESAAPEIGIGMLGYAFMGKAHSNAYKTLPYMMYPPPAVPRLVGICGRAESATAAAAQRYGYEQYYTDWREMLKNDDIQLLDNGGPNDTHAEPCIAAAQAGKHVLCEKPLARTAGEAAAMLEAVTRAGVKHQVMLNYRFVPAIRLAKDLIEAGRLGRIYHFRAAYLQDWLMPQFNTGYLWRLDKTAAGTGAIGDLGAHVIDLARYLVGEPRRVAAASQTFTTQRPDAAGKMQRVDVDDAFASTVEFENGAVGSIECSRMAAGRKNYNRLEVNGEKGSLSFNLERMNELEVYWVDEEHQLTQGFHDVLVTEGSHPYLSHWWPPGHIIGWEHTFAHAIHHLLDAIVNDTDVAPYGATFDDGYKVAVIGDAILKSAQSGRRVDIAY